VRFVNRQRGSGTRLLLDTMLEEQGIDARGIDGYMTEEYTHAAVAAYVASGMADAGLGVEPAARQFNLGFVPIAGERYFLICARQTQQYPWVQELLRLMRGPEFQELVASLPGYLADRSGEIMELAEAFPWLRRAAGRQRGVQERKRQKA
jgi:putative molybdopterin biosynthesis protein